VTVERPRRGQRWLELGALALLIVTGVAMFRPFFVPLAWAAILAYATWPLFQRMETRLRGRTAWAAGAMTALIVLVVVAPAVLVSLALAAEAQQVYLDLKAWAARQPLVLPAWMGQIPWIGPQVRSWLESLVADPAGARQWLVAQAGPWARTIVTMVGDLGRNLAGAGLALFTLFFLYRHGSALLSQVERATHRLAGKRVHAMLLPLGQTVRAVTYGMLLTALAQGALATLGYGVTGLGAPVLLGAATTLLALIPFGAPIVYVPVSAWLLVQGRPLAGLLLLAWGILVVSTVDNLIRSWFISGTTRVPFLLVFLGVLGGLATFGAIGLFVGPVTITLLLVLWREWTSVEPGDAP
jgi:predicted PurR-regulated permease PerM